MKSFFIFVMLLTASAIPVQAFDAVTEIVPVQYEVVKIENPDIRRVILGELDNSPEMYEIVLDDPLTLNLEIRALPSEDGALPQISGIVIREKEVRGVEEVARLKAEDAAWEPLVDRHTGLVYLKGADYTEHLEAGTYRVEISTPQNVGKYMLVVGEGEDDNGYFAALSDIKMVYHFYGLSTLKMFGSPFVHYPLGIVILLILIAGTYVWQKRRNVKVVVVPHLSAKHHTHD